MLPGRQGFECKHSGLIPVCIGELCWYCNLDCRLAVSTCVWVVRVVCKVGKRIKATHFAVSEFLFGMVHKYKEFVNTVHELFVCSMSVIEPICN